jgi:drug/metabolite transporter (DMT)-like permease
MTVLLFAMVIVSAGAAGNLYRRLSQKSGCAWDTARMPLFWFLPLCAFFVITALTKGKSAVWWAAVAGGIAMYVADFLLVESMKKASLSIPVILINLSFIIPVMLSILILNEKTLPLQLVGMLISAGAVLALNYRRGEGKGMLLLPVITCLVNGLLNFCIKLNNEAGGDTDAFFAVFYGAGTLCGIVCACITALRREMRDAPVNADGIPVPFMSILRDNLVPLALLCLANGVCFWAKSLLAGMVNAAALFTITTSAAMAFTLLIGALFQREKITWRVAMSFVACLCAILCQAGGL